MRVIPERRVVMCAASLAGLGVLLAGLHAAPAPGTAAESGAGAAFRLAAPGGKRAFRMGFTPFPYDTTLEALVDGKRFLSQNADIIAQHMESVPWTEALENKPFHKNLTAEWQRRKDLLPGARVYLGLSPGRGNALSNYWGEKENLPVPAAFANKSFDDPDVKRAYLNYCERAVAFFRPDYLGIGIEVNELYGASPARWAAYVELHRHVYRELKRKHPRLRVFASFTLHNLLNHGASGKENTDMLRAFRQIMPCNDLVAVSFYPFLAGLSGDVDTSLAWLTRSFDAYDKPYAFVETGEAAEKLTFPKSGIVIAGTPARQRAYYEKLLRLAQTRRFAFVISYLYRDYDALWDKIQASSPEFFAAWRDCGLVDEKGVKRPACRVWESAFQTPFETPPPR